MLTVQQIFCLHSILLDGLHPCRGRIRESVVYTQTKDGETHYYPAPEVVESQLYGVIDHHNIHMESLENYQTTTAEKLEYLLKCAAWLLFHFVSAHPFVDGNGRTCRLLCNYVLGLLVPFPVSVYHNCKDRDPRDDYIDAIVRCRRSPTHDLSELAAMVAEGIWLGLKKICASNG